MIGFWAMKPGSHVRHFSHPWCDLASPKIQVFMHFTHLDFPILSHYSLQQQQKSSSSSKVWGDLLCSTVPRLWIVLTLIWSFQNIDIPFQNPKLVTDKDDSCTEGPRQSGFGFMWVLQMQLFRQSSADNPICPTWARGRKAAKEHSLWHPI